jgi:hypothetical protein
VEARLAAELAQHGLLAMPDRPVPRAIEWDDIPKLTYLQAIIKVPAEPLDSNITWHCKSQLSHGTAIGTPAGMILTQAPDMLWRRKQCGSTLPAELPRCASPRGARTSSWVAGS